MANQTALTKNGKTLSSLQLSQTLTQDVCRVCDVKTGFVELVALAYQNQIRKIDERMAKVGISAIIPNVAQLYGNRQNMDRQLLNECVRLVYDRFRFLALSEIEEAYRQWASGEIQIKGAEMYGGVFNVRQLGQVLDAYNRKRKKVVGELLKQIAQAKEKAEEATRMNILKAQFETEFPKSLMAAKETITDWRDIPHFWYQAALDRGYFEFMITATRNEAKEIFAEAQQLYKTESQEEKEKNEALSFKEMISKRNNDPSKEIQRIARKLTVFKKIIQNPKFKI